MTPTPQLIRGLPFRDYQDMPGWNPSRVKTALLTSPLALRWEIEHETEDDSTPAMRLGTAVTMQALGARRIVRGAMVARDTAPRQLTASEQAARDHAMRIGAVITSAQETARVLGA